MRVRQCGGCYWPSENKEVRWNAGIADADDRIKDDDWLSGEATGLTGFFGVKRRATTRVA